MKKLIIYISLLLFIFVSLLACGTGGGSGDDRKDNLPDAQLQAFRNFLTKLISLHSDGTQATNESANPFMNSTGRFVVFESLASDLVPGDIRGFRDIFVHDRDTDNDGDFDEPGFIKTVRASVDSSGAEVDNASANPSISSTGRFVAFESLATDLVPGDTNGQRDIFVHDRDTDNDGDLDEPGFIKTVRVSVDSSGGQADNAPIFPESSNPFISTTGRFVVFESLASDLVPGDIRGFRDIFVHDRDTDNDGDFDEPGFIKTVRASVDSSGAEVDNASANPSISSTGRFVAFESLATDLVPGDTNGQRDIFVHDRDTDNDGDLDEPGFIKTVRVSVDSSGGQADNAPIFPESSNPFISTTGRFVVFESLASDLVPGDIRGFRDIFVHDRDTDNDGDFDEPGFIKTVRVSVDSSGAEVDNASSNPSISATGRFVVFESLATDLVSPNTTALRRHIYIHDRDVSNDGNFDQPGDISTELVSVATESTDLGNNDSFNPTVSTDGRFVAFDSDASNLLGGPGTDQGGYRDIFVRDRNP